MAQAILYRSIIRHIARDEEGGDSDVLDIEWHERGLRVLRRETRAGKKINVLLSPGEMLDHGVVLGGITLKSAQTPTVVVNLLPCETLVIRRSPADKWTRIAYALGNFHVPAEINESEILVPASDANEAVLGRLGITFDLAIRRVRPDLDSLPTFAMTIARTQK